MKVLERIADYKNNIPSKVTNNFQHLCGAKIVTSILWVVLIAGFSGLHLLPLQGIFNYLLLVPLVSGLLLAYFDKEKRIELRKNVVAPSLVMVFGSAFLIPILEAIKLPEKNPELTSTTLFGLILTLVVAKSWVALVGYMLTVFARTRDED